MTNALPTVRVATPADESDVLAMCRRLHEENGVFALNEEKVRECLQKCFNRAGTIVGVIGAPGKLEASTCMEFSSFYYTDDWHLAELWNFVDKDHRNTANAAALLEFCKSCALKMRMPLFTGIITNKQMAGKVRLYRRTLGYPAGAFFIFNSAWKSEPMTEHRELVKQLQEVAKSANNGKIAKKDSQKLAQLIGEAAQAITRLENLWSGDKPNGVGGAGVALGKSSKNQHRDV